MKKFLSLLICLSVMLSCVVIGIGATTVYAAKYEASPESDFIAFDGVIEEYIGPGGDVVIPAEIDGVPTVEIAQDAFVNNTEITGLVIPEGIEKIGHRAFKGCTNLVKVELPYSLYQLGAEVFHSAAITEIVIPGNLTKVAYGSFSSCPLSEIKISNGVKEIHTGAFFQAMPSRVIFPESVELIASASFNYLKTNARIEFVICNPDLTLGVKVVKGGLWEDMMKGNWTDEIFRPWNSSTSHDQVFNIIVPEDSSIAEFVKEWKTNGLLEVGKESGACNNSYVVQEKDEAYFEKIAEEVAEYSIEDTRADLTFEGGVSSTDGDDGTDDTDDNTDNDKTSSNDTNKNSSSTTTTVVEEGDNSMMWIILAVVGGVFLLLIIGVVVFAVIFLKKPAKAAVPQTVYMMGPDGKIVPVVAEQPVVTEAPAEEVAEEPKTEDAE